MSSQKMIMLMPLYFVSNMNKNFLILLRKRIDFEIGSTIELKQCYNSYLKHFKAQIIQVALFII